jgi:uncharacterized protein
MAMAKAKTKTKAKTTTKSNGKAKSGGMTVAEAGRKGGLTVRDERGHEFYEEIGRKGGQRVRDLIAAGKKALARGK